MILMLLSDHTTIPSKNRCLKHREKGGLKKKGPGLAGHPVVSVGALLISSFSIGRLPAQVVSFTEVPCDTCKLAAGDFDAALAAVGASGEDRLGAY